MDGSKSNYVVLELGQSDERDGLTLCVPFKTRR